MGASRIRHRVRRTRTAGRETAADLRWGIGGLIGAILLVVGIGMVYVAETDSGRTYSAELASAGAVRAGDDVRVAGIPVGKVTALTLLPDRVRMTFTVAGSVFLGDRTAVDIRMLTVVGGYYVAVQPSGTKPLGANVIPEDRVTLPYNLAQTFQDAVAPVRGIDGDTLRRDLAAVSASIGKSPDAVRAAVRAAGDLVGVLDKQNSDISRTLSMTDEYLSALRANADVLSRLLTNLAGMETIIKNDKVVVAQALNDLADIVQELSPLGHAWDASLKQRAQPLADTVPQLRELGDRLGALLDSLQAFEQRLLTLAPPGAGPAVDQSAATVTLPDICVPVPGGGC
ncbi:MCE family protein [Nocardia stercoris]|uniref:MCE family protein n=2 Tax=Nocardia stercoris TaxID=2483361 RepID=A0A3M2L0M4_9NOCA|nr:MCE family protein [Nocardia stercoris]